MSTRQDKKAARAIRIARNGDQIHDLTPLLAAGLDHPTAAALTLARNTQKHHPAILDADAAVYAATGDRDLIITLVNDDIDTRRLLNDEGEAAGNLNDIAACLHHAITYSELQNWTATGHTNSELVQLRHALRVRAGTGAARIIDAVTQGVTIDDLHWLDAHCPNALSYPLLVHERLRGDTHTAARRLVLAIETAGHGPEHANAIALAADGAPWIDTLTILITDGIELDDAVVTARAEHDLHAREEAKTVQRRRAARPPRNPDDNTGHTP
jgi:hypothetical protein